MKHPAMNPYLPLWEYVPDGEPHIWGDRLYVYGSHDVAGSTQFCEGDYVVWSAPLDDLGSWKYEGISYPYTATPMDGTICIIIVENTIPVRSLSATHRRGPSPICAT